MSLRDGHTRLFPYLLSLPVVVVAWILYLPGVHAFPLDDAYIHLAYVRNLATSGSFAFNPGEPSLGTSSPLWVMLLCIPRWLHLADYWSVQCIGLAFLLATCAVTVTIVRDGAARFIGGDTRASFAALAAGLLVALNGDLHWMACSGMETTLVLFLTFLTIWLYSRRGFDPVVGVLAGLLFGARAPGAVLAVVLVGFELGRGEVRRAVRGAVGCALAVLPFVGISLAITGGLMPTTAQGKKLTYVDSGIDLDGILHFSGRFIAFQKYLPHNYALFGLALLGIAAALVRRGPLRARIARGVATQTAASVVAVWGFCHFMAYATGFRTIGQQGRYMVEEQIVFIVLGVLGLAYAATRWSSRRAATLVASLCVVGCAAAFPYWRRVYRDNVQHVDQAYLQMAKWVNANTEPSARFAAFDIGVLRYVADRYTIDLGGLVDPKAHSCIRERDCSAYARENGVTHFLFAKEPEADDISGIQLRAELRHDLFVRDTPLATFRYPDYEAPTLTHSFRLEVDRIDGWFRRDAPDLLRAFAPEPSIENQGPHGQVDDAIDLLGAVIDIDDVRYMRGYPYYFTLTLHYRAHAEVKHPVWMHVGFFDAKDGRLVTAYHDLVMQGLLPVARWPVGEVVRDHHVYFVPYASPNSPWRIRVAFSEIEQFDERYPELYDWMDVGEMKCSRSATNPLAPQ